MKKCNLFLIMVCVMTLASVVNADVIGGVSYIQPVLATASSQFVLSTKPWLYSPEDLIDDFIAYQDETYTVPGGLNAATGEHSNLSYFPNRDDYEGYIWMSDGAIDPTPADTWVTFDLGAQYELTGMRIWNGNVQANGETTRGVSEMYVLVSADGVNYTQVGGLYNLTQASGLSTYLGEEYDLIASGIQYVKFDIQNTFRYASGGDQYTALSEVRFIPEPATLSLLALGGLALLKRKQR